MADGCGFRDLQSIIDLDLKAADSTLRLGEAKQRLHRAEILYAEILYTEVTYRAELQIDAGIAIPATCFCW